MSYGGDNQDDASTMNASKKIKNLASEFLGVIYNTYLERYLIIE
jgi:hypothetical protein